MVLTVKGQTVVLPQWVVIAVVSAILSLFGWFGNRAIKEHDAEILEMRQATITRELFEAEKKLMQIEIANLTERVKTLERANRWRKK